MADTCIDYKREFDLIRRLERVATCTDMAEACGRPALALAELFGRKRLAEALGAVKTLSNWSEQTQAIAERVWKYRYGHRGLYQSAVVRSLAKCSPLVASLNLPHCQLGYRDVYGIPVAPDPYGSSKWFYSPARPAEILARAREAGSRWVIDKKGGLYVDDARVSAVIAADTRDIIHRVQRYDTCRAWILWGPPRGGKSIAARQIAHAIGDGWVRVCGRAAAEGEVWEALRELRPAALILDDLDTCAHNEDDLLGWIEDARGWARVIVSTMNVLPKAEDRSSTPRKRPPLGPNEAYAKDDHSEHELRGALLAPGRAADETPRQYATLDPVIRAALAPDVPEDLRAADLLAGYLCELQLRATHGGVTSDDVDEMRRLMTAAGDR